MTTLYFEAEYEDDLRPLTRSDDYTLIRAAVPNDTIQVGRGEGSVEHVEVFLVDNEGTSILEDLDPCPRTATATPSNAMSP